MKISEHSKILKILKIADLIDFPLHFLYKRKGKSSKSADLDSQRENALKSTYLGEFLMDFKNFDSFEVQIIPSRAVGRQN